VKTQAIVMRRIGGPDVLAPRAVELTWPGDDDAVLVRLHAASVNPADIYFRAFGPYLGDGEGSVLGHDGAGIVEAVGPAVSRVQIGDRVCFCNGGIGADPGTYARHAVVPESLLAAIPERVSFEQAAALPLVFITIWESLYERARIAEGDHVLIHAGAGGTGHVGVQVARLLGARVATTVSTPEKVEIATKLGADRPILYRDEDFVQAALDWTGGRGLDVVLDNVGADVLRRSFDAMAVYGRAVTLIALAGDTEEGAAYNKNLTVANVMMLTPMWYGMRERMAEQATMIAKGLAWLAEGRLALHVAECFPLERVAEAHRRIEAGGVAGKLVITMSN
jgi:NADPH:quinone reductase